MKKLLLSILLIATSYVANCQTTYTINEPVVLSNGLEASNILMQASIDDNGFSNIGELKFKLEFWSSLEAKESGSDKIYPSLIYKFLDSISGKKIYKVDKGMAIEKSTVRFTATDTVSLEPPFIVADIYLFALEKLAKELKENFNWTIK